MHKSCALVELEIHFMEIIWLLDSITILEYHE